VYILATSLITIAASSALLGSSWQVFASGEKWEAFVLGWWGFGMLPAVIVAALSAICWVVASRTRPTRGLLLAIIILNTGVTLAVLWLGGAWGAGIVAWEVGPKIWPSICSTALFCGSQANLAVNAPGLASRRLQGKRCATRPARYRGRWPDKGNNNG
jgi:hypothetical protein